MSSTDDEHPSDRPTQCLVNPQVEELADHLRSGTFVWADFDGPSDTELQKIGKLLNLHPLTIQDAQHFHERPKFEEYPGYAYVVMYGVDPAATSGNPMLREVHMIVSGTAIITIRHQPIETLEALHKRYADEGPSRQMLTYEILDAITSTFFPVLARIDEDIDGIEGTVISNPSEQSLQQIFSLKRDLVAMRRVVTPMRDLFARRAERIADLPGMDPNYRLYFRDLYDTLIRISDLVDSYRDLLSGATDLYLSTIANRQGEVNKQLTVIATIFLPLTFLTGFFGQNFAYLTGHVLNTQLAFWVLGMGSLAVSVVIFWWYFRRKGWIGG